MYWEQTSSARLWSSRTIKNKPMNQSWTNPHQGESSKQHRCTTPGPPRRSAWLRVLLTGCEPLWTWSPTVSADWSAKDYRTFSEQLGDPLTTVAQTLTVLADRMMAPWRPAVSPEPQERLWRQNPSALRRLERPAQQQGAHAPVDRCRPVPLARKVVQHHIRLKVPSLFLSLSLMVLLDQSSVWLDWFRPSLLLWMLNRQVVSGTFVGHQHHRPPESDWI